MAILGIGRGLGSGYGQNPSFGDTFSPTPGNIIVVSFAAWNDASTGVNGWGIDFEQLGTGQSVPGNFQAAWAGIVGASPGTDQVQVLTNDWVQWDGIVAEISGLDTGGTIQDVFVQTLQGTAYNVDPYIIGGGFPSAFSSAENGTLSLPSCSVPSVVFTPQAGFTDVQSNSPGNRMSLSVHLLDDEEQNPHVSGQGTYKSAGGFAFELAGGAGEAGPSMTVLRRRGR